MVVFCCAGCGAELTVPVTRVALPVHARNSYGHALLPPLMRAGTYAVDPEPFGPPWRAWDESEAEARRLFAPVLLLSDGAAGSIVVAPGDTRGTVLIPERCDGYCYGVDGRSGPNLACASCGLEVGTRIDDCSRWQEVRFVPDSVRFEPSEESLVEDWTFEGLPPVEPSGAWSPYWEAAVGDALAHLFAVSGGGTIAVEDGFVSAVFGAALALPSSGPPRRNLALAGPGLPDSDDIALVPRHPVTGRPWPHSSATDVVPLAAEVWTWLAFGQDPVTAPVSGVMPAGVLRDDPLPKRPSGFLSPAPDVFLYTLARLPGVRQPCLRAIYDRVKAGGPVSRTV
ncbi:hypothetical protein [Amycolatopsis keratiniphila]|uniref:hypothetical protein n=1 Tax=Amycolatopsis keratiniphila TaxID=129921 RepID=UPI00087B6005|nr:hypothetical protein [Amycolatopsis keratiniphila]OLZ49965.1 hypothetical protein BS330_31055 [Amycolatopsis keratiniphila subsp. nogabecina]SDU23955.1 hypothetical protein SAMN04489733_2321 [Amycolatopsis keratiniphila]